MTKEFKTDILKYLPAKIIPTFLAFITLPVLTRLFSPEEFGNYSFAIATINVLSIFNGWVNQSNIRFYAEYEKRGDLSLFFSNNINLSIFSIAISLIFYFLAIYIIRRNINLQLRQLLLISSLLFVIKTFYFVLENFLRARREVYLYSFFFNWEHITHFLFGIFIVYIFRTSVDGIIWGACLGLSIMMPILWKKAFAELKWQPIISRELAKNLLSYGYPLVISNIAAWILSLSDRYFIEFLRSSEEVGIYSANYTIANSSISVLTSLVLLASHPIGVKIFENNKINDVRQFESLVTKFYLLLAVPSFFGLLIISKPLVITILDSTFLKGYTIIPVVGLGAVFFGLQQRFQVALLYYKKTKMISYVIISASILNLILNYFFVPIFGYIGAAYTTLLSYAFLSTLMIILSRKYLIWKFPFKTLVNSLIASSIMGLLIFCLVEYRVEVSLLILFQNIILGIIVYLLIILLFKEIKIQDIINIFKSQ